MAVAAVLLVTAAAYCQTAFFDFVYDDLGQIVYNPGIKSWRLALDYFRSHLWSQTGGLPLYYRPAFMLWLTANYAMFGLHAAYWHIAAVALHLLCCALLYSFTRRLTQERWVAVAAVFLFGLHPAHVESVAWISGATETFLAILALGALLCYMKRADSASPARRRPWLSASLFLASAAVMAKETAIILPALIFSYEWIFPQQDARLKARTVSSVRAAIPYALVVTVYLVIRTMALQRLSPPHTTVGLLAVILGWPKVVLFYLTHILFPLRMSAFYELIAVGQPGFRNVVVPLILISLGGLALCYMSRRSRVFAFLSVAGVLMLVPLLTVTLLYNVENIHDRYLYLPSALFCIMLASLLARLKEIGAGRTAWAALAIIAAGYALVTVRESRYWRNDLLLAEHGLTLSPGHPLAEQVLGNAYIRRRQMEDAIPHLLDSLDAQPQNVDTLTSLGLCYLEMNALPLAEKFLSRALRQNPSAPRPHLLLGVLRLRQNRLNEAEAELRRGIALYRLPEKVLWFHYYLGDVLYRKGDLRGARAEYLLELQNEQTATPLTEQAQARLEAIGNPSRTPARR